MCCPSITQLMKELHYGKTWKIEYHDLTRICLHDVGILFVEEGETNFKQNLII